MDRYALDVSGENSLCVDRKRMEQTKMLAEFLHFCMCTRWSKNTEG